MTTIDRQQLPDTDRLVAALTDLHGSGVLSQDQCDAVLSAYRDAPPSHAPDEQGSGLGPMAPLAVPGENRLRARLFEAAGYLGGILVGASILALLGQYWDDLTTTGHVLTLTALAALAWIVGVVIARTTPGGLKELLSGARSPRRRVASVLLTVGSLLVAAAVGEGFPDGDWTLVAVAVTALVLLVIAHRIAPSALTEVGMFAATVSVVGGIVQATLGGTPSEPVADEGGPPTRAFDYVLPISVSATGLVWAGLIAPRLRLPLVGTVLGLATAVYVSIPLAGNNATRTAGLILLAVLTGLGLLVYQRMQIWPWLALAALSLTAFVVTLVGQSAGAAAGLLSAGLILLGATAWGVRRAQKRNTSDT